MKRIKIATGLTLASVFLVGCANPNGVPGEHSGSSVTNQSPDGDVYVFDTQTPRGTYQCIAWDGDSYSGGMDCEPVE